MRKLTLVSRLAWRGAFTLVELMIVVVIVAILATVAIPMYRASIMDAQMSEGIAGCGMIRTAARVKIAVSTVLPDPCNLGDLNIVSADLDGKYFDVGDYSFTRDGDTAYTIRVTHPDDSTVYYEIDEDGAESGTFTTE